MRHSDPSSNGPGAAGGPQLTGKAVGGGAAGLHGGERLLQGTHLEGAAAVVAAAVVAAAPRVACRQAAHAHAQPCRHAVGVR